MRQAAARTRNVLAKQRLEAGMGVIFVRRGKSATHRDCLAGAREGYRVLEVEVRDVTPGRVKTRAMQGLVIACDARALDYVQACLVEMGEKLDGEVVVT